MYINGKLYQPFGMRYESNSSWWFQPVRLSSNDDIVIEHPDCADYLRLKLVKCRNNDPALWQSGYIQWVKKQEWIDPDKYYLYRYVSQAPKSERVVQFMLSFFS